MSENSPSIAGLPQILPTPVARHLPASADALPVVGELWREIYQVSEMISDFDFPTGRVWRALRVDTAESVLLRAISETVDTEARAKTWAHLQKLTLTLLPRCLERLAVGGYRVEVQIQPPGTPLKSWRDRSGDVDEALVHNVLQPLVEALDALHGLGLGHFAVDAGNVYVREENGVLLVMLAGLEGVAPFDQAGLLSVRVDPFYAPPEAAGLVQHSPGPGLRAWDWWSLGRVIQELILGRHILGHILSRDVSRPTPELNLRAETLLLERESEASRAGAVEAMPEQTPRLNLLLRGLLSSSRDGRWGSEEIGRWLRQEPVKERYAIARHERLFHWRNRVYTVPEVAVILSTAEHWALAVAQIYDDKTAETLAHFIGEAPAHRPLREKLDELLKLAESAEVQTLTSDLARDLVTALALQHFSGAEFIWRGDRVNAAFLGKLLNDDETAVAHRALIRVLTSRRILAYVERTDGEVASFLGDTGTNIAATEAILRQPGWLVDDDTEGEARAFSLALTEPANLRAIFEVFRKRFACSTDEAMDRLFKTQNLSRAELAALAWVQRDPVRFGFLTHAEWAERELEGLQTRAGRLVTALFWKRLGAPLAAGPLVFGRWFFLVGVWIAVAALLAIAKPGPTWLPLAFAPLALAFAVRMGLNRLLASAVLRGAPETRPWRRDDGVARCRQELKLAKVEHSAAAITRELKEINQGIVSLANLATAETRVVLPPKFICAWVVAIMGWVGFCTLVGGAGWQLVEHPPTWAGIKEAWFPRMEIGPDGLDPITRAAKEKARLAAEKAAAELAAIEEARRLEAAKKAREPILISWPHKLSPEADVLLVKDSVQVTLAQHGIAIERGRALTDSFKPETIVDLIAIQVPTDEKRFGLVLFDGQKKGLAAEKVYLVDYLPYSRTTVEIAGKKAFYVGN